MDYGEGAAGLGLAFAASDIKSAPGSSNGERSREREERESALRNEVDMLRQQVMRMEERIAQPREDGTEVLPSYEEEIGGERQLDSNR